VDETRALLDRYGPVKALDSLGYRQAMTVLSGTSSMEEAVKAAQQGHRNYAKRQLTWFRREPDVHWLESFGDRGGDAACGNRTCATKPVSVCPARWLRSPKVRNGPNTHH